MLGPVLESINDELLDPAIDRVLGIMRRAGLFPAAPSELEGVDFKVEYISILAQAQRAVQTVSVEQGVNFTSALAQQGWPEAVDRIEVDGTIDSYLERNPWSCFVRDSRPLQTLQHPVLRRVSNSQPTAAKNHI